MTGNFYYLKSKKKYICRDNISFKQLVKKLNNSSPYLFQIVLDKNNKFLGTITDGDLRKFIINNNIDNTSKINKMINKNANVGKDGKDNFNKDKLNKFLSISKKKTDFLPIVDKKNFLTDILIFDNGFNLSPLPPAKIKHAKLL